MAGEAIVPGWGDLPTIILLYENDVIQSSEYLRLYICSHSWSEKLLFSVINTETCNWVSG